MTFKKVKWNQHLYPNACRMVWELNGVMANRRPRKYGGNNLIYGREKIFNSFGLTFLDRKPEPAMVIVYYTGDGSDNTMSFGNGYHLSYRIDNIPDWLDVRARKYQRIYGKRRSRKVQSHMMVARVCRELGYELV